ncbi:uncharacterized protein LOC115874989 [Sitophilus oryzae]|uniref:Uncharacterized protein LOC115874989 n=1 Tax=Sitophilus oryzae TaxID=7048 RepID=A0A6J2X588_SITOR|nr:uncharacterized protein LOC115874989 [Sitophilus oryzae]
MDESLIENCDDLVRVKLGFQIGEQFTSFKEFQEKLLTRARANFVRFSRKDSRTIEAARKIINRTYQADLIFYQLKYACFYSNKSRTNNKPLKRKRRSLRQKIDTPCPAFISLRLSEDDRALEIINMVEYHNHPVTEEDYQKLIPKKKSLEDEEGNISFENINTPEDKYKIVLNKCRHIARIASLSSPSKVQEILKNMDDYVFYLKYSFPNSEVDELIEGEQQIETSIVDPLLHNENIKIIVESDPNIE